jgi:Zn-dependent protease with chaperone function
MKKNFYLILSLLFFLLLGQTVAYAQYLNPKLKSKQVVVRNVVILPPKIDIIRESTKGAEGMVEESAALSLKVADLVAQALQQKKINVLATPFTNQASEADADKKYTLADIQSRYDALLPKMVNHSKDIKKERFTLGDEVLTLNVDKSADAIVFIRGQGKKLTKGRTALTLLNPFSFNFPFIFITIGLVDAHTGEVLALAKPATLGDVTSPKAEKALRKMLVKSLKKLPDAP